MSAEYQRVDQEDDKNESLARPSEWSVSRKTLHCFVALTILNIALAITSFYYSLQISQVVRNNSGVDIASLPRIDSITGDYIPSSGGEWFYNIDSALLCGLNIYDIRRYKLSLTIELLNSLFLYSPGSAGNSLFKCITRHRRLNS